MQRLLTACLLGGLFALSAEAALPEGARAPEFAAEAALAGNVVRYDLKEARTKGPVVVYFYPSAFTNGCNIQAHEFAVNHDKFTAAGATIVGVSLDSIARLKAFSADPEFCAGKITVVSDVGGRIAKSYDIAVREAPGGRKDTRGADIDHGLAERTTFIVGPDCAIAATIGVLAPAANVARALEVVHGLASRGSGK